MATQQIQGDGTLGPVTRPRNSDRFVRPGVLDTGDPQGLIALLEWRSRWYAGGCEGLDVPYTVGDLAADAGADLAAALERIRTLDALVAAERAERQALEGERLTLLVGAGELTIERDALKAKLAEAAREVQLKIAELAQRLEEERALRDAIVLESAEKIAGLKAHLDVTGAALEAANGDLENERNVHAQTRGELERVRLRAQAAERDLEAAKAEHCPGCDDAECQRGADH